MEEEVVDLIDDDNSVKMEELSQTKTEVRTGDSDMNEAEGPRLSVIIVGAGFAGLAAADELHSLECDVLVLEARDRVGGRCFTAKVADANVDLGAGWIHGIEENPITELATRYGATRHDLGESFLMHDADGCLVESSLDEAADGHFQQLLEQAKQSLLIGGAKQDAALGDLLKQLAQSTGTDRGGKQMELQRQLFAWHCAHIEYASGADTDKLSARHWFQQDKEFGGPHCLLTNGFQTLAECLAQGLNIRRRCIVASIKHSESPDTKCEVVCVDGQVFESDVVIVTVPLGVLKAGAIRFEPPLPPWKRQAIESVGFGLLNKVVLVFERRFWPTTASHFGMAAHCKPDFYMLIDISDACSKPTLVAFVAASAASELEQLPDEEVVARAMLRVSKLADPHGCPAPLAARVTRWGQDEFARGSYSYVAAGASLDAMNLLAAPLETRKIFFAGEATIDDYHSTVHGAFMSGRREAQNVINFRYRRDHHSSRLPDATPAHVGAKALCYLCKRGDAARGLEGPLVGPFAPWEDKPSRQVYVHARCAAYSPEVARIDGEWFGVCDAIRRGTTLVCSFCGRPGATVGCFVCSCPAAYHVRCCAETGWDFERPDWGKLFYCAKHRI